MAIDPLGVAESGPSSRAKLNSAIAETNNTAVGSGLINLYENGALGEAGKDVRLYVPDFASAAFHARFAPVVDAYMNGLGCTTALAVLAAQGGSGNLVAAEVSTLAPGGYVYLSVLVKSSDGGWSFGGAANSLMAFLRFSDGTNQLLSLSAAPGAYEDVASNVRRYFVSSAVTAGKRIIRIEIGVNNTGIRTSDFYLTGFWASWSRASIAVERTGYPNWRHCARSRRSLERARMVDQLRADVDVLQAHAGITALDDLRAALQDDLRSILLVLIGDSNTWGMSATGNSPSEPRSHALSDPRDNLNSASWANLLRKWLGYKVANGNGLTQPQAGSGRYIDPVMVDPIRHPAFSVHLTATDAKVVSPVISDPRPGGGPVLGKNIDIVPGQELRFRFTGDRFAVYFAKLNNDPAATFDIVIDGVTVASPSHYAASSAFSFSEEVSTDFGTHAVRLVNKSASSNLRVEAIEHFRSVEVINQGIVGTTSTSWLPAGALLSAAVPSNATHAMIMLGTNDRAASAQPRQSAKVADNVEAIVTWLLANRPEIQPLIYSPPIARGNSEQGGAGTFYFTASEVGRALGAMCARKGYAFVDLNAELKAAELAGANPLVADDLHLSDAGHLARFNLDSRLLSTR